MCRGNDTTYDQVVPSVNNTPDILEKLTNAIHDELFIRNFLKNNVFSASKSDHRSHSTTGISNNNSEVSVIVQNRKRKLKHVKFADECEQPLATVLEYEHPMLKECTSHLVPHWKTAFVQPFNDFENFHEKLSKNVLSLENALLLEDPHQLYGTIAALNVGEEMQVYIRYTFDGWRSYEDVQAPLLSASSLFDIYYFVLNIPKPSVETNCIEFYVYCDIDDKRAFIDNNNGTNYVVMLEMKPQDLPTFKKVNRKRKKKRHHNRYVVENLDHVNEVWLNYDQ